MKTLTFCTSLVLLSGCSASDSNSSSPSSTNQDTVKISYKAVSDDAGGCRPTYEATTPKDGEGMPFNKIYMIKGETYYNNAEGRRIGNIPLQIKMEDETISLLNEVIACENLTIKLEIEECTYQWGTERNDCPEIIIQGQENFGGIELTMNLKNSSG